MSLAWVCEVWNWAGLVGREFRCCRAVIRLDFWSFRTSKWNLSSERSIEAGYLGQYGWPEDPELCKDGLQFVDVLGSLEHVQLSYVSTI